MTYVPAKVEVAVSNGLGGDAVARKYIINNTKCCPVPSMSCDLFTCEVTMSKEEMNLQENTLFDL